MKLIDTHSHVDMLEKNTIDEVIFNASSVGVEKIIVPAADVGSFENIIKLATDYKQIFGALGVHPESVSTWDDTFSQKIFDSAKNAKVVAIGEIGLDYYWDKTNANAQKMMFIKQIKIANELNLPLIVHDRDAHKDCYETLLANNKGSDVIMHCFSGSVEFMNECVNKGFYIGIGGVVTFKNAKKMKDVATNCPLDKLLLETDAPYLTPVPHRGEENQPAFVKFVAEEVAFLKNITLEELAKTTSDNAERVFKI